MFNGYRPVKRLCERVDRLARGAQAPAPLAACDVEPAKPRCSYQNVEEVNSKLLPLLDELRRTAYFRYFKVNLFCECPLWPEDGMCALEACSVCECDDHELPPAWQQEQRDGCGASLARAEAESAVNRTLADSTMQRLLHLPAWRGFDNPWLPESDANVEYSYINLLVNPERYTGYAGEHAHRIWNAIYSQNCFADVRSATCDHESKVFYRIISGVHTSISAHIAREYLLDEATDEWGPNLEVFRERLGSDSRREHVQNMYFVYLFVLKALERASPVLRVVDYHTGVPAEDARAQALVNEILSADVLHEACGLPFDEARMWKGEAGSLLKGQLQAAFQNITTVLDCVGCEKCKLWGKLQFLGVATALKVLFSAEDCDDTALGPAELLAALRLERNEVIALVNLAHRLAESIETYRSMSAELAAATGVERCCHAQHAIFDDAW